MLILAFTALAFQVVAQSWEAGGHPSRRTVPSADSTRIVRSARSAQNAFESFRRARLPVGRGMGGTCDIRIGRYCYWRGDEDDDKPAPPEPADVRDRRTSLIRMLDSASRMITGDAWIAGQHVRYLVEAGRIDDAWSFSTRECGASVSWCSALAGYTAHSAQRFAAADSMYGVALAAMDSAERCRWLDASMLLDDALQHRFDRLDCPSREELVRRIFWFGAPLYSISATDLFTEHLARVTRAKIAEHSAGIDGEAWADDQRELMTRYGWPQWYSQSIPPFGSQGRPSITGHDSGLPYNYIPTLVRSSAWATSLPTIGISTTRAHRPATRRPSRVRCTTFRVRSPVSGAATPPSSSRRGTRVATRPSSAAARGALRRAGDRPGHHRATRRHNRGTHRGNRRHRLRPRESRVARGGRSSRRARSHRLPPRTTGASRSQTSCCTRRPRARQPNSTRYGQCAGRSAVSGVARRRRVLGVVRCSCEGEPVHFTLTVEQIDVGLARRAAERLHLADPTSALRIQWDEVAGAARWIAGRGVRVDLSRLRGGRYLVNWR